MPTMTDERHIRLIEPKMELEAEFRELVKEYQKAGMEHYLKLYADTLDDFGYYVNKLRDVAEGRGLPPGWVPSSTFWLVHNDNKILGTSRLRHRLNGFLEQEGGHIGYDIRPSEQGKGYGTLMLALTLAKAKEYGMSCVLVISDASNLASFRVIEKNGGQLENKIISKESGKTILRYWIGLIQDK